MKIITLSMVAISTPTLTPFVNQSGAPYLAITHGEQGRGRWQLRLPIDPQCFDDSLGPLPIIARQNGCIACSRCGHVSISRREGAKCEWCADAFASATRKWIAKTHFGLRKARTHDAKGQDRYILTPGENDGRYLVLWSLSPGYRGNATYVIDGKARLLAKGQEAQGDPDRMSGTVCPLVLVEGPAALSWKRFGRLYGTPLAWTAWFDGAAWTVGPKDEAAPGPDL